MSGRITLYIFQVDSAVVNIISHCVEDAIQTLKQYLPSSDIKLLKKEKVSFGNQYINTLIK
jgi:hypothetical protein